MVPVQVSPSHSFKSTSDTTLPFLSTQNFLKHQYSSILDEKKRVLKVTNMTRHAGRWSEAKLFSPRLGDEGRSNATELHSHFSWSTPPLRAAWKFLIPCSFHSRDEAYICAHDVVLSIPGAHTHNVWSNNELELSWMHQGYERQRRNLSPRSTAHPPDNETRARFLYRTKWQRKRYRKKNQRIHVQWVLWFSVILISQRCCWSYLLTLLLVLLFIPPALVSDIDGVNSSRE